MKVLVEGGKVVLEPVAADEKEVTVAPRAKWEEYQQQLYDWIMRKYNAMASGQITKDEYNQALTEYNQLMALGSAEGLLPGRTELPALRSTRALWSAAGPDSRVVQL